jgi:glycosyltransferase involved in cell wall biosynthesis
LVVPPGDAGRLAAACVAVLTDSRLRHELAGAARRRARTLFSLSAMVDGYRTVYAQAQARRPDPNQRLTLDQAVIS